MTGWQIILSSFQIFLDKEIILDYYIGMVTTITGKHQVTIPAQLVKQLALEPGTRLDWKINDEGMIIVRPLPQRGTLAHRAEGMGRAWLSAGQDPIAELIEERAQADALEGLL